MDLSLANDEVHGYLERYGAEPGTFWSAARQVLLAITPMPAIISSPRTALQQPSPNRRRSTTSSTFATIRSASSATSACEACGSEAQNTFAIAVAGRGFDARISTEFAAPLPDSACVYCGNCIDVCPTGALMFKSEHDMRDEGTWDESRQTVTDTICPYCGVGCTLELHVQDNNIVQCDVAAGA